MPKGLESSCKGPLTIFWTCLPSEEGILSKISLLWEIIFLPNERGGLSSPSLPAYETSSLGNCFFGTLSAFKKKSEMMHIFYWTSRCQLFLFILGLILMGASFGFCSVFYLLLFLSCLQWSLEQNTNQTSQLLERGMQLLHPLTSLKWGSTWEIGLSKPYCVGGFFYSNFIRLRTLQLEVTSDNWFEVVVVFS